MNIGSFIRLANLAVQDPLAAIFQIQEKMNPNSLWRRYAKRSAQTDIDGLSFVLSFDCDTPEDYKVVSKVHKRLEGLGARPVYAVPGELLAQGKSAYKPIAESGAEFINHGGRSHTFYNDDKSRYESCFFYEEQTRDILREDIALGHQYVKDVLGITAKGFRAPHFGSFQKPDELQFLHDELKKMDYQFSSSTTPIWAYKKGPVFNDFGLLEFPVTGMHSRPLCILDTWTFFEAPDRIFSGDDFGNESNKLVQQFDGNGTGIINVYGDPSHIHDAEVFYDAVEAILKIAKPKHFSDLVGSI